MQVFDTWRTRHGEPDRNGSHPYPWLMIAHLAAGIAADSSEEFEKYLVQLQPHVRTCLSLSPSTTFSMDIETCYPVDTERDSPMAEYKQGMKELAAKFDAQTVRTVAKLRDQFGYPSAKVLAHELHMRKCPKSWVACAKIYTCEWCATQHKPGLVRVAAIPRAQFFNHVVDTDIYIVKWQGKKRRIQAIMVEFTRFEAEARIKRETVQCEIKGFEKLWLGWAGTPIVLRCDMSGAHMSDEFASWCDGHGIKLELIPKAHHKLAIQERNHAVRRNQLFSFEKMYPLDGMARLSLPRIWISLFWIGVIGLCKIWNGSALFRCTHEQLRPETVDERDNRESLTETHMPAPNLDTIRGMLSKIKGPVRFVDLKGKERPCVHSPPPPAQPQQAYEPTEAEQRAAAHAARQHQQATAPTPIVPENTPTVDEAAPKPSVAATEKTTSRQSGPADDPMSTGLPRAKRRALQQRSSWTRFRSSGGSHQFRAWTTPGTTSARSS